jgi:hypothetical protein
MALQFDATLQANTRVFLYTYNTYIYYIYRCKNMLFSFDGREMALVVNETQALSAVPRTQRAPRGKTKEAHNWAADRCRRSTGKMAERDR